MRNMVNEMNSRTEETEEQIRDLEDRALENNQVEQKRKKRIMQNESRLRELSDSIKCSNICIRIVPEEDGEKGVENLCEKTNS